MWNVGKVWQIKVWTAVYRDISFDNRTFFLLNSQFFSSKHWCWNYVKNKNIHRRWHWSHWTSTLIDVVVVNTTDLTLPVVTWHALRVIALLNRLNTWVHVMCWFSGWTQLTPITVEKNSRKKKPRGEKINILPKLNLIFPGLSRRHDWAIYTCGNTCVIFNPVIWSVKLEHTTHPCGLWNTHTQHTTHN